MKKIIIFVLCFSIFLILFFYDKEKNIKDNQNIQKDFVSKNNYERLENFNTVQEKSNLKNNDIKDDKYGEIEITDELLEKIIGKWKTNFFVYDKIGREDWNPMVINDKIVSISKEKVDYLEYTIEEPLFYAYNYTRDEQTTIKAHSTDILKFDGNIIHLNISAKDDSTYPHYYGISFIIVDDKVFLKYQGAYFEVTKIIE